MHASVVCAFVQVIFHTIIRRSGDLGRSQLE